MHARHAGDGDVRTATSILEGSRTRRIAFTRRRSLQTAVAAFGSLAGRMICELSGYLASWPGARYFLSVTVLPLRLVMLAIFCWTPAASEAQARPLLAYEPPLICLASSTATLLGSLGTRPPGCAASGLHHVSPSPTAFDFPFEAGVLSSSAANSRRVHSFSPAVVAL